MFGKVVVISQDIGLYHSIEKCISKQFEIVYQAFPYDGGELIGATILYIIKHSIFTERSLCVVKSIRLRDDFTPILLLSEQIEREQKVKEKVRAIEAGVDEYLAYPQATEEIIASVRALIRRTKHILDGNTLSIKQGFIINLGSRKIYLKGEEISFTKLEFDIIYYLASNQNRVITYKELYEAVWHRKYLCDDMNIMAHIHRIRQKLESDPKHPEIIQNVYGIGYRFVS